MFFKRIESSGLAHYSYMAGDQGQLVVIDPRRDVDVYLEQAHRQGAAIVAILETHRNEDYIIGSRELSELTGAQIYLSGHEDFGYEYGTMIRDGFTLEAGGLIFQAIHTPGHTVGHLCYALYEKGRETPYMVFTGDSLFTGDLARTDFYGRENLEQMTGHLYESVFKKLLPLGDEVLIMPAHGAGSACGQSMEERPYSTLGYERRYNVQLQDQSKEGFIQRFGRMRERPRHFDRMRQLNVKGAAPLGLGFSLQPVSLDKAVKDIILVDCRPREAFFGGHIPGSVYMNPQSLSSYLGAVLDLDTPIAFVTDETQTDVLEDVYRQSLRIGFDQVRGFVPDAIGEWQNAGNSLEPLRAVSAREFMGLTDDYLLLDIRKENELRDTDPKEHRLHIPLEELYARHHEIPRDKPVYVLCTSGNRSTTAASLLKRHGHDPRVITGGSLALQELKAHH